jgi:hypothetical protein
MPFPNVTPEMLYQEQELDTWCRRIAERFESGLAGYAWSAEGLLLKATEAPDRYQVLVPQRLREPLMHLAHLPPQGALLGVKRMFAKLARQYMWPSTARDYARYVARCISCAAVKPIDIRERE